MFEEAYPMWLSEQEIRGSEVSEEDGMLLQPELQLA